MTQTIDIPFWQFALLIAFAAVTFASHFLFPSVRWFFRRRFERAVAQLNTRLARPIEPFKLMRRADNINRLLYDPQVMEAVVAHAKAEGVREDVAFEKARRYAREIVPGFSTATYFGFAIRIGHWLTQALYRVRIERVEMSVAGIPPEATVVFVMNHRSNMDYVLVTWLVADNTTLSYAVGEWARIWPLRWLVRASGAYFIRRRKITPLYRSVLARYVQMARDNGVTQAIFPEGGLSRDGRLGAPKLGLLSYLWDGFDPEKGRDVVFVPVGLNYDRVFEDAALVAAPPKGRFKLSWRRVIGAVLPEVWPILAGRQRFGHAAVSFGAPVSLRAAMLAGGRVEDLGRELMARVGASVPILPVPLVADLLLAGPPELEEAALDAAFRDRMTGATPVPLTDASAPADFTLEDGLRVLLRRGLVTRENGRITVAAEAGPMLRYYANTLPGRQTPPPEAPETPEKYVIAT
ncbi:1-acyl-sn-glycerol-3-phosphate acyltransferase [Dinoroseobacter sp. PD6]|uniref:1-acyl-sn-glycerol-3-phosphate acyltransferase n=1 Tax=Dinoroseobacter sp. PD6 TaxID=3028384 RepID=UPI00237BBB72|nr:1-acyl-sn-glycerol-3-phosphate acyltransferase [Dinoroseobacter sp. PD6]MDD9716970.1 1-acyl-sn-glycerol-3-phosphate acyltransferase [Dinoroseobacter sp. PD6]